MVQLSEVDSFHRLVYEAAVDGKSWGGATYMGYRCWKWPPDMWSYQEVIWQVKPRLIIETGTAFGGSALYFAHLLDQLGVGKVVSVDLNSVRMDYPRHPRITYLGGKSSTDPEVLAEVRGMWRHCGCEPNNGSFGACMVILDSDHKRAHVLSELATYHRYVTPGSYLVLEDTNVNGHPVYPEHGPGPREALDAWLPKYEDFRVDENRSSKFLFSMHTWLRRRRK